eukprot:3088690-Alexandrium_andersonii.AAC.1
MWLGGIGDDHGIIIGVDTDYPHHYADTARASCGQRSRLASSARRRGAPSGGGSGGQVASRSGLQTQRHEAQGVRAAGQQRAATGRTDGQRKYLYLSRNKVVQPMEL